MYHNLARPRPAILENSSYSTVITLSEWKQVKKCEKVNSKFIYLKNLLTFHLIRPVLVYLLSLQTCPPQTQLLPHPTQSISTHTHPADFDLKPKDVTKPDSPVASIKPTRKTTWAEDERATLAKMVLNKPQSIKPMRHGGGVPVIAPTRQTCRIRLTCQRQTSSAKVLTWQTTCTICTTALGANIC